MPWLDWTRIPMLVWLMAASLGGVGLGPNRAHSDTFSVTSRVLSLCGECEALILGERHHEPESALLFLDVVQSLIAQGERLLIGLEISAHQQVALNAVLRSKRSPSGVAPPSIDSPSYQTLLIELSRLWPVYGARSR